MTTTKFALLTSLCLCSGNAFAQSVEKEPAAVLELGGTTAWNLRDGRSIFGPDIAVEVTPIKNWLEFEAGVTPLFSRHSTEWDTDLLFKKPWTLSKRAELMIGIGPEWVHTNEYGMKTNSVAGEAAVDFMFWPSENHRFGWFVEPGYEYSFGPGHERSLRVSAGLLIAIP